MDLTHIERYELREVIGVGGMGSVYRAFDPRIQQEVAIKVPNLRIDQGDIELRAKRELKVLLTLRDHPGIVTTYDFTSKPFGIVMELLKGQSLREIIHNNPKGIPADRALTLIQHTLIAVAYAHHHNVLHRDLKPGNIFVTQLAGQEVLKVMDFGLAALFDNDDSRFTKSGLVMGTPAYMAPEQCLSQVLDQRTDVYAIGLLLYELLTGRRPFEKTSEFEMMRSQVEDEIPLPSKENNLVPAVVDALLEKATRKNPEERFLDCDAFVEAINEAKQLLSTSNFTPSPIIRSKTPFNSTPVSEMASVKDLASIGNITTIAQNAQKPPPQTVNLLKENESKQNPRFIRQYWKVITTILAFLVVLVAFVVFLFSKKEKNPLVETSNLLIHPLAGASCGPCELDQWIQTESGLVCSGETDCPTAPIEHSLLLCDDLTPCVGGQICLVGFCVNERSAVVGLAEPQALPTVPWLEEYWPDATALPRNVTIDSHKEYERLYNVPNLFEGERQSHRIYNGATVHVLSTICGSDNGRWANVRVLTNPYDPNNEDDLIGEEGWLRRQILSPHGNGCCSGRNFDCGWRAEEEDSFYNEIPVVANLVAVEPVVAETFRVADNTMYLRETPSYHYNREDSLARLRRGEHVTISREICTMSGYHWVYVQYGTLEDDDFAEGWSLRMSLSAEGPKCCLGRELVDNACN